MRQEKADRKDLRGLRLSQGDEAPSSGRYRCLLCNRPAPDLVDRAVDKPPSHVTPQLPPSSRTPRTPRGGMSPSPQTSPRPIAATADSGGGGRRPDSAFMGWMMDQNLPSAAYGLDFSRPPPNTERGTDERIYQGVIQQEEDDGLAHITGRDSAEESTLRGLYLPPLHLPGSPHSMNTRPVATSSPGALTPSQQAAQRRGLEKRTSSTSMIHPRATNVVKSGEARSMSSLGHTVPLVKTPFDRTLPNHSPSPSNSGGQSARNRRFMSNQSSGSVTPS